MSHKGTKSTKGDRKGMKSEAAERGSKEAKKRALVGKWAGQDLNLRGALPRGCFTGTFLRPLGHRPGVVNGSGGS